MEKLLSENDQSNVIRWSLPSTPFLTSFLFVFIPSIVALIFGGLLDSAISKWQGNNTTQKGECLKYFLIQLITNILLFIILLKTRHVFLEWIQLTVSGIISTVLFFSVQQQLQNNSECLTTF